MTKNGELLLWKRHIYCDLWRKRSKMETLLIAFPRLLHELSAFTWHPFCGISLRIFRENYQIQFDNQNKVITPPRLDSKRPAKDLSKMTTPVKKVPIHLQSAQNRLLIKNGTVVNHDGQESTDVYIEDSRIKQMGSHLIIPGGTRVIDATGKFILPGGIDANVHLETPFLNNAEVRHCHYNPEFDINSQLCRLLVRSMIILFYRLPQGLLMIFTKGPKQLWPEERPQSLTAWCPPKKNPL